MTRQFLQFLYVAILLPLVFSRAIYATKRKAVPKKVSTGLDELMKNPAVLKDKRLALIVNHSAIDSKGRHIIDLLYPKFKVVKIFAPEHGVRGNFDEHVSNDKDDKTGLPIISLYQKNKKAPTVEELADVDLLVFDIQEIGLRYYTYATTMVLAMKAAQAAGKKMLILDRPNMAAPLGVYGPTLESKFHGGFAGYYPIPIAHAMTIGELARFYNTHFNIGADIEVVKMKKYNHKMFYDETGLPWRNPSPNITGMQSVLGYHLAGALETLNISVGRGTDNPFQLYGAPFFNVKEIVKALNSARLPGIKFYPAKFTPTRSAYARQLCLGFKMVVTNRRRLKPMHTLITIAREIYKQLPPKTREQNWQRIANSVGDTAFIEKIAKGERVEKLVQLTQKDVDAFKAERKKYLMYP
jgi:uncharacterized protein YbbC (DUF1343 family)